MSNPIIQVHAPAAFVPTQVLPLRGTPEADGLSAVLQVQVLGTSSSGGTLAILDTFATTTDTVPEVVSEEVLGTVSFAYGYNEATTQFQRIRSDEPVDNMSSTLGTLSTLGFGVLFHGNGWDRTRSLSADNLAAFSGIGGQVSAGPGEWAVEHRPAVSTQATISRAAVAGVRHVARSITASLVAVAAQTVVDVLLRDGATGAGTVLWSTRVSAPAGGNVQVSLTGLNIVGSVNTAMTLEFSAAPVATNFEGVALTGYDAS